MSDVITTLKRKGDSTTSIYPNIKTNNIPSGAVTSVKLASNSVTNPKIVDNAITTEKIYDGAVTNEKLADYSVDRDKLADNCVYMTHLHPTIRQFLLQVENTYLVYMQNSDETFKAVMGTTTLWELGDYSESELEHAFDFNKNQVDYTQTDLAILKMFIDGYVNNGVGDITNGQIGFDIHVVNGEYGIRMYDYANDEWLFNLEFEDDLEITTFVKTKYPIIEYKQLINTHINIT